jgi:nicotinate-nucleotide--dimethylbenzimidazole phosphoribosyltransferase
MMNYRETIKQIEPPDKKAAAACRRRWNDIATPLYGLGMLEECHVRIAAIQGTAHPDIRRKALAVFCADNGVVEEGVTQTGQEVTAIVAENFPDGISCAALMCRKAGADLFPVDVGMAVDTPRIEKRKLRYGTGNITKGPAMTREEAIRTIEAGIEKASELKQMGYGLLAAGEMGIGNTATSAAVTAVLLDRDPADVTGRGSGLSDEALLHKQEVIRKAIRLNAPDPSDPLDVLSKLGGFDIAAMTGLYLGGAACRLPVVADGFISLTAALLAVRIAPACRDYILPSHASSEPAVRMLLEALEMKSVIHAGMHCGEGTGAAAFFPLLDMADEVYRKMASFEEIRVTKYEDYKNS